jgi:Gas vesicle synthesis protein GvpO
MADKTHEARARRSAERDERRSRVAEPFEEMDETARDQESAPNGQLAGTAAKVVGSAVAAALLGAAGAAAKRLLERQRGDEQETPKQPGSENDENDAAQDVVSAESQSTAEEAPADVPDSGEAEEESPQPAEDREQQDEQDANVTRGVSGGEAGEVVAQARRQLEGLLGVEPERVSGLARVDGGWSVMLEVVEVSRVPESTDVLGTYELRLDDDLNIVAVNRQRRYRRSQIDEAS